jgi:hypothetical protein
MGVYVDEPMWSYGRMTMCHMFADSREELDAMADRIGVARKWIQKAGTHREHYDIAKTKRALAVEHGAIEITMRGVAELLRSRRAPTTETPDNG